MDHQRIRNDVAAATRGIQRATEIDGVPQHDGGRDESDAAGTVLLGLGRTVVQPAQAMEAHGAGERVAALALVQLRRCLSAELRLLQSVQSKQRPLNAPDLPQCQRQPVRRQRPQTSSCSRDAQLKWSYG